MIVAWAVLVVLMGAIGPPVPAGVGEGDMVEIDGVLYQRRGDKLYTLDDEALDDTTPSITVTGSRLDRDRREKVLRAEAIDDDALRELGARTLADVLEEQGGLQVNGSLGLGAEVTIDGLDGRHVLILIDGRPVNGKVNNRVDVSRLPVSASSIKRIEIVRGPMSALYGSDALAGVVNIITKKPDGDVSIEGELGGQILPGAPLWTTFGLHGTGGLGPLALRLDVTAADLPGFDRGGRTTGATVPDGKADVPDRRNGSVNVDVAALLGEDWSLRATLLGSLSRTSAVVAPSAPFRDAADNGEIAMATQLSGDVDVGLPRALSVSTDLRVDRFTHRFFKLPTGGDDDAPPFCGAFPDPACPADPQTRTLARKDEARLELRGDAVFVDDPDRRTLLGRELSLSVGAVLLQEQAARENDVGDDTLPGGGQRTTASVYGEGLWRPLSFLTVLPGARVDAFLVDGSGTVDDAFALGPKMAARLDGPFGLAARASVGRGFRLPSFEERFLRFDHSELGYIVEGNPSLAPEQSTGLRVEGLWAPRESLALPVDIGVEFALNVLENLITEASDGVSDDGIPLFTYENAARAFIAALTTRATLGPVDVGAGLVHVHARLDGTYQYLLNAVDASRCPASDPWLCSAEEGARSLPLRPAHSVDLTGRLVFAATDTVFFARADMLSERPLVDDTAPGAVVLSCGVRQPLPLPDGDGGEIVVGLENLLDHTDPVFGPKPGRHVSFSLRFGNGP